jgi:lipopolysaccharide heptosyltransferase II
MRPLLNALADRVLGALPAARANAINQPISTPIRRLLVVKLYGMGDSIMIRSLLEHLRVMRPDLEIGVLVSRATRDVISCASQFRVHLYEQTYGARGLLRLAKLMRDLRACRYDAFLDFEQGSLLAAGFLALARIPVSIGFSARPGDPRSRFRSHTVALREEESVWTSFCRLTRVVAPDLPRNISTLPLPCTEANRTWVADWWQRHFGGRGGPVLVLHLGTGPWGTYRRWPVTRFVGLAERLRSEFPGLTVVLCGTAADKEPVDEFIARYSGCVIRATDVGSIERTALIVGNCDLFIGNDSGVMHLAAAMGTPTLGLFGATTPRHWAPVGPRTAYVCETHLPCSPCINTYRGISPDHCTYVEQSRCMKDITVERAFAEVQRLVQRKLVPMASESF